MIILRRNLGGIILELVAPCITGIDIDGIAITVQLPYGGNLHMVPTFVVETDFPEISRTLVCIRYPEEFPRTVQGHIICRLALLAFHGSICRLISKVIGVHRSTIHCIDLRIKPLFKGLCICSQSQSCK